MRGLPRFPLLSSRTPPVFAPWRACGKFLAGSGLFLALAGCGTTNQSLALPKSGGPIPVSLKHEPTAAEQAFWDQISPAQVLYIPETHTNNSDHEYQFDVLKGLKSRGADFVIGWEMFDETQQPLLDQWSAHQLTTEALLDKTDWARHWGGMSVMYEKMLRWSLGEGVNSLALNAPQTLSHKMATGAEFTPDERAMLPDGFRALPGGYEHFAEQMNQSAHGGMGTGSLPNMYKAQLVWEQTMATRVLDFIAAHPNTKLIVLLGRGHVDGGFGVPAFVRQRSSVTQLVLYPGRAPAERAPAAARGTIAQRRRQVPAISKDSSARLAAVNRFPSSKSVFEPVMSDALTRPN